MSPKGARIKKYLRRLKEVPSYTPPGHFKTTNYRLLGPGPDGSDRLEIILGQIEYGGQADCHIHENSEQAFFVLEGKALLQIEGEEELISPNDLIYLPKGTSHKVVPVEGQPLKLLIVYAPPLSPDEPDG
jgi:mannose-6-phosphate isomerase-like protein (cupin superfamily)